MGLIVILVVPAIYALDACGRTRCQDGFFSFTVILVMFFSHFITLPLAIFVAAYSFFSLETRLSRGAWSSGALSTGPARSDHQRSRTPMRKVFRTTICGWIVVLAVWGGWIARSVLQKNSFCKADEQLIGNETDAINLAQRRISKARYLSSDLATAPDDKPYVVNFGPADGCCQAIRTRSWWGVIVWEVSLSGETVGEVRRRHVNATIRLSNCGVVFDEESFISAEPIRE